MMKLNDRSTGKILDILEAVMLEGVASIGTYTLLHIYGKDRATKAMWRDITERWERLCEEQEYEVTPGLLIGYETGYHLVCFAFGDEIDPKTKLPTPFLRPAASYLGVAASESEAEPE